MIRFRGHLILMGGGGIHDAEIETAVPAGVPTADDGADRLDDVMAKQVDLVAAVHGAADRRPRCRPLVVATLGAPGRLGSWFMSIRSYGSDSSAARSRRDESARALGGSSDGIARCPRWLRPLTGTSTCVRPGGPHARPHRSADRARRSLTPLARGRFSRATDRETGAGYGRDYTAPYCRWGPKLKFRYMQ